MSENRLAINADKSNYVIMDLNNRASPALDLKIGSQDLPKAYETKILGVVIDNRLSFKSHIDNTCNKVRQRIGVLKKTRHCLPVPALNLVYRSIIQPIIDYGITVYGFTYKTHTDRILSLQNRAAKVILPFIDQSQHRMERLKWKTFYQRRSYFANIQIFRCVESIAPMKCRSLFEIKRRANTRSASNREIYIQRASTKAFAQSIFVAGAQTYNTLDLSIRNSKTTLSFAKKLRSL